MKKCRNKRVRKPLEELEYQIPFILKSFRDPQDYINTRERADLDERIFRTLVGRVLRHLNKRKSRQLKPIKV